MGQPSTLVASAYGAYRDGLYAYLMAATRQRESAEDLVHEAFARLAREVAAGRAPINTRAWLYRVAGNLATSSIRRVKVADRCLTRLPQQAQAASAEEECTQRDTVARLQALMSTMNPVDQVVLRMTAEGYSGAEIARAVGLSGTAVRTRVFRARERLRRAMAGH